MPQINALDLAMTPKSLADINNVKVDYLPDVWKWQQNASQRDQTTLADMMRAAAEEEAMGPGRLQKQQADLQSTLLGNQEKEQDIRNKTMNNELGKYLLPQKKITEWKKLIGEASDTDFRMAENEVYTMLRSQDPKIRAVGKQLESGLKEAVTQRLQGDQQLRVQGANNAAAMARQKQQQAHQIELEKMRVNRALRVAEIGAAARKAAGAAKSPKDWEALATALGQEMLSEKDSELKAVLVQQIEYAQMMAERLKNMPPQINPEAVGGGKLTDPKAAPMPSAPGMAPKAGTRENPIKLD